MFTRTSTKRTSTKLMCALLAGAMAAGSLFAAPDPQAEAFKLLKQVKSTAAELTKDAAILDSYSRGDISREGHIVQLNMVKNHINTMGKQLDRLQAIRNVSAPWQSDAINSVLPVALSLASHTEAAIQHLNQSGSPLWAPNYTDHLKAISDRSDSVKQAIDLHLDLAATQDKLNRLLDRVETEGDDNV